MAPDYQKAGGFQSRGLWAKTGLYIRDQQGKYIPIEDLSLLYLHPLLKEEKQQLAKETPSLRKGPGIWG